jgi:hypothetical protein
MRKTLTYSTFAIASLVVVAAFLTATTYIQLAFATLLYPLLAYFAFELFADRTWSIHINKPAIPTVMARPPSEPRGEKVDIVDIDKRAFLKLIGAAGLSFFLFSIFNQKAASLFSRRTVDGIAPPSSSPPDYRISEIDDSDITFYGFTKLDGGWFIMKEDTNGSFRYIKGDSNFSGNWDNRERLNYDYFHNVF